MNNKNSNLKIILITKKKLDVVMNVDIFYIKIVEHICFNLTINSPKATIYSKV